MEYFSAKMIREQWGDKPCDHSKLEREFYGDTYTLDYVCTQCGKEFNLLEALELKEKQRNVRKISA